MYPVEDLSNFVKDRFAISNKRYKHITFSAADLDIHISSGLFIERSKGRCFGGNGYVRLQGEVNTKGAVVDVLLSKSVVFRYLASLALLPPQAPVLLRDLELLSPL